MTLSGVIRLGPVLAMPLVCLPATLHNSPLKWTLGTLLDDDGMILLYNQPSSIWTGEKLFTVGTDSRGVLWQRTWQKNAINPGPREIFGRDRPDDHASPAFCMSGESPDFVLSAWHGTPMRLWRRAGDPPSHPWGKRPTAYPRCIALNDESYLVVSRGHPTNGEPVARYGMLIGAEFDRLGDSKPARPIIDWGEGFIVYAGPMRVHGNRIAISWTLMNMDGEEAPGLWFAESRDGGRTWTGGKNELLGETILNTTTRIWADPGGRTLRVLDMRWSPEGWQMAVTAPRGKPFGAAEPVQGWIIRVEPEGVKIEEVGEVLSSYYPVGLCLDARDPSIAYATVPKEPTNELVQLKRVRGHWQKLRSLAWHPERWMNSPQPIEGPEGGPRVIWGESLKYDRFDQFRSALYVWPAP